MSPNNLVSLPKSYDAICTTSTIESDKFTFVWKISEFSSRTEENGQRLSSEEFTIKGPGDKITKWNVGMYPKGVNGNSKGFISVYLYNTKENDVYAKYVLSCMEQNIYDSGVQKFEKRGTPKDNWGAAMAVNRNHKGSHQKEKKD